MRGEPGSPEFTASYNEAVARKVDGPKGTLKSLLDGYQQSSDFLDRRERTKTDYKQKIKQIEEQFGSPLFQIAAVAVFSLGGAISLRSRAEGPASAFLGKL